jgi:hypothetical protein
MLSLLFADDTTCLTSGNDLKNVIKKAKLELQKLSQCFRANKMAVNVSKTKYIICKPSNKKVKIGAGEGIIFNNTDIGKLTMKAKFLSSIEFMTTTLMYRTGPLNCLERTLMKI